LQKIEILLKKRGISNNQTKPKPNRFKAKAMASSTVKQILVGQPSKMKIKILKKKPAVTLVLDDPLPLPLPNPTEPSLPEKSIWLQMRRAPRIKIEPPLVWQNVEDISDDENDTPQAAGKRLSTMKATRDRMQRRAYQQKFDEYQCAGLFLNWAKPKPLETHSNYSFEVSTTAYPRK